jgi:hypothetical protein
MKTAMVAAEISLLNLAVASPSQTYSMYLTPDDLAIIDH